MTNKEKAELRQLVKEEYSFKEIRQIVKCGNTTIKNYMKIFSPNRKKGTFHIAG